MKTAKNKIVNTQAQVRHHPILGLIEAMGDGEGIVASEARGQRQLLASQVLPSEIRPYTVEVNGERVERSSIKLLESWGFTFGKHVGGDTIFRQATLPAGWSKKGSDHDMWSSIVDEKGRERCSIFYKAASYDRSAFLNVSLRYDVTCELQNEKSVDSPARGVVKEGAAVLFTGPWREDTTEQKAAIAKRVPVKGDLAYEAARKDAIAWFRENLPNDIADQWARP